MDPENSDNIQLATARRSLPASKKRGRGRGSVRPRGPVVRGRVRGRARARGANLQADREAAAATILERKKEEMRGVINNMAEHEVRELLLRTVEKEPTFMQDVMDMAQPSPADNQPGGSEPSPSGGSEEVPWCTCSFCREMPQPEENLCCGKEPQHCLSRLARFQMLVLDEDVLDVARMYRQDVLAVPAEFDRNKGRRHAAYRQFTLWKHGRLGAGNRRPIPSCCVLKIRAKYPDRFGQYTGFISGRLG